MREPEVRSIEIGWPKIKRTHCFLGGGKISIKTLCQICANLINTSWHLVAQHATSVTVSMIKLRVNKLHPCFGSRGSEVQIFSPRPFKTGTSYLLKVGFIYYMGRFGFLSTDILRICSRFLDFKPIFFESEITSASSP